MGAAGSSRTSDNLYFSVVAAPEDYAMGNGQGRNFCYSIALKQKLFQSVLGVADNKSRAQTFCNSRTY